jgi:integrase
MQSVYKREVGGCSVYYAILNDRGRSVRRSTGCSDKEDAQRKAGQMQRLLDRGELEVKQARGTLSSSDAWELYYSWAIRHKRERTVTHEKIFWDQFWAWQKGTNLLAVTSEHTLKWRDQYARVPCSTGSARSAHSVNDALRALATIWARLIVLKHAKVNPFSTSETPRIPTPKRRPKYLTSQEVERALLAAQHYSLDAYLFTAIGLYAGLRKAEILNLKWTDIQADRVDDAGNIIGCLYVWEAEGVRLKTAAASRVVPLHPVLKDILSRHRDENEDRYVVRPRFTHVNSSGHRWDPRKAFIEMSTQLGRKVTPHMLRHTFASLLAGSGVSLYKVSKWLGHTSITTTEIYAHLCPLDSDIGRM